MAKHRVSMKEEGRPAKNRDIRRSPVGNKGTCVPTGALLSESVGTHTMACSNFHILLESNNVTTRRRRGNPTTGRRGGNLQPARRYYLTPDVPYISERSCVPAARLDPRFDRGNNDRMERTMGEQGARVETLLPLSTRL